MDQHFVSDFDISEIDLDTVEIVSEDTPAEARDQIVNFLRRAVIPDNKFIVGNKMWSCPKDATIWRSTTVSEFKFQVPILQNCGSNMVLFLGCFGSPNDDRHWNGTWHMGNRIVKFTAHNKEQ